MQACAPQKAQIKSAQSFIELVMFSCFFCFHSNLTTKGVQKEAG